MRLTFWVAEAALFAAIVGVIATVPHPWSHDKFDRPPAGYRPLGSSLAKKQLKRVG
jgi:hypothetical protein